jgi:Fe2+ transport system protein FeoA
MVQSGGKFRVVGPAERNRGRQKLKRRLCDMGLRPGAEGEVIVNRYGPLVVCIDGMRIAMGREMGDSVDVVLVD